MKVNENFWCSVGTEHETKNFGVCTVVRYVSNKEVYVEFSDGTVVKSRSGNIKLCNVRNPNQPTVFGVGIKDSDIHCLDKRYILWSSILRRSYSEVYQKEKPTYKPVTVCDRWKRLSNFAEDIVNIPFFEKSKTDNYQLDKDILMIGNNIYSPETVCFIPSEINSFFSNVKSNKGLPSGISWNEKLSKYVVVCRSYPKVGHVGCYEDLETAKCAYIKAKSEKLKHLLEKYHGMIDERVYTTLNEIGMNHFI